MAEIGRNLATEVVVSQRQFPEGCEAPKSSGHASCEVEFGEVEYHNARLARPFSTLHSIVATRRSGVVQLQPVQLDVVRLVGEQGCPALERSLVFTQP